MADTDRIRYAASYEIVGVARDMRYMTWNYKEPIGPMFWVPETQNLKYDDPQFAVGEVFANYALEKA